MNQFETNRLAVELYYVELEQVLYFLNMSILGLYDNVSEATPCSG